MGKARDQDLLANRWTEVLVAEEYELECPSKSYPKRRLLPRLEEEAPKPTSPAHDAAATQRPLGPPLKPHPGAAQKYQGTGKCARPVRYIGGQGKANKIDLQITWAPHGTRR